MTEEEIGCHAMSAGVDVAGEGPRQLHPMMESGDNPHYPPSQAESDVPRLPLIV